MINLAKEIPQSLQNLIILFVLVVAAGLIVLAVILVKKYVKPLQIHKDDVDEETAAKEELDRVLIPIEDEEIQKQMEADMKKNAK